nr:Ribonuclease III domain-containing protein [Ipomoea batatas]
MGYETWLPNPPKVEKPRSAFNAASLAYIGDCIFELYARRHFLFPPLNIEEHNKRVMAVVRCEAQSRLYDRLTAFLFIYQFFRGVLRWGKNVGSGKTRTKKRAGVAVYNSASSLETLIGYLYLTNMQRLEEIMLKLGFCTGVSSQHILENINGKFIFNIQSSA